ncbi:MAG: thioredoxin fold domain-containing protein [Alphaproteobacteria bacterium]|nr:thioredoxin fold domain-containing protein [Alphaproteobacteria bacterium]
MSRFHLFSCLGVFSLILAFAYTPANSQPADPLPNLPAPIENLVNEGAQIRYLGKDNGMDAWLTIKNGVEQYFYVLPDQSAFVMGVMFDADGKLVTVQQVQRLRAQGDTLLDTLTEFPTPQASETEKPFEFKTPAEKMFADIESSNWVALGKPGAPVMYSFIDPQCPHCHNFIEELQSSGYFDSGQLQLRMIPVGFREETRAQAAYLIATPNPEERWFKHMEGDETALPAKSEINQQGVQRNLAIMQSWKFNVTPMIVYRGKDGSVKLVRGKPQSAASVIADIGNAG